MQLLRLDPGLLDHLAPARGVGLDGPEVGDAIVNYNWLEPIAFPVAMGADISHSQDKREIDRAMGLLGA